MNTLTAASVVAGLIASLMTIGFMLWRGIKALHREAVDEIDKRVERALVPVHAQLQTNGGFSLKDQVTRIEARVIGIEQRLDEQQ